MGVDISGYVHYGCVFNRKDIIHILRDAGADEDLSDAFEVGIDVYDSVDCYSGSDYEKELYVVLPETGASVGRKGGDCEVLDKDAFAITEKDLAFLKGALAKLGITDKIKSEGWIFRTYLS